MTNDTDVYEFEILKNSNCFFIHNILNDDSRKYVSKGLLKYISYKYDSVNGSLWWTNQ